MQIAGMIPRNGILLLLVGILALTAPGLSLAGDWRPTVVTVVSLDAQAHPGRQGLGVVVGQDGRILTSATLLGPEARAVIKTASGSLHLLEGVLAEDGLHALVEIKVEAQEWEAAAPVPAGKMRAGEKFFLPMRSGQSRVMAETRLVKVLPLSPRLTLLKLEPAGLAVEPGAPLFNGKGQVAGMAHAFSGGAGALHLFLALNAGDFRGFKGRQREAENAAGRVKRPPEEGLASFWEAVAAGSRGAYREAQEKFTAALKAHEPLPEAYYGRGVARYHLGNLKGAAEDLRQANARLPGYALAWLWLGKALEGQKEQQAAQAAYQQAGAADPDLSEVWFHLGELAYLQGSQAKARQYLGRVQDDFEEACRSWWYLGNLDRWASRPEEALKAYQRAIELNRGFFPAYLEGGKVLLLDLGRPQEAMPLLQQGVKLKPDHPLVRYYLALADILTWNSRGAWEQYFALQKIDSDLAASLAKLLEQGE